MARDQLPAEKVGRIKALISLGWKQVDIAQDCAVAQSVVSLVKSGQRYEEVPWPNGLMGGYKNAYRSKQRVDEVEWSTHALRYMEWPEEARLGMLSAVNARRLAAGMDPVPDIAVEWELYMNHEGDDPDEEDRRRIVGHEAENRRRGLIFQEFQELVARQLDEKRDRDIDEMFASPPPPIGTLARESASDQDVSVIDLTLHAIRPWEDIKIIASRHPLVQRAASTRDTVLMTALEITFGAVPPSQWREESVIRAVQEVDAKLRAGPRRAAG